MEIKKYTYDEISNDYPALHNEIFGQMDPTHLPGIIYVGYEGEQYIGFLSGYYHDTVTLYIQRIGMPPGLRGQHLALNFFYEVMEHLKKEGHVFLIGHVENTNIPTLLVALHAGWIISGVHTDSAGKTYVRILKDLR